MGGLFPFRKFTIGDGQFEIWTWSALPMEPGERLFFRMRDGLHRVRTLQDLEGHLEIPNPQEALRFVRLRSSTVLHPSLLNDGFEGEIRIDPKEEGIVRELAALTHDRSGLQTFAIDGVVTKAEFARLGLKEPVVQATDDSFIVDRYVVEGRRNGSVLHLREAVTRRGGYSVLRKEVLDNTETRRVKWRAFMYE